MDKHTHQEERKLEAPQEKRAGAAKSQPSPMKSIMFIAAGGSLFDMPPQDIMELGSRTGNSALGDLMGAEQAPVTSFALPAGPAGTQINRIHAGPIALTGPIDTAGAGGQTPFPVSSIGERSSGSAWV